MITARKHIMGYFFICVLLGAFIASAQRVFQVSVDKKSVLNGELSQEYERQFDAGLFHTNISISLWKTLKYKFFGEAIKGALIGSEDWIFTEEEFSFDKQYSQNIKTNQGYIASTIEVLSKAGVQVLVVPIPAKSRIFEEYLGRYKFPEYRRYIYSNFLKFLEHKNIKSVDLLPVFFENKEQPIFFKTDTHWTSLGAQLTAKAIALQLKLKSSSQNFVSSVNKKITFQGDLVNFTSEDIFPDEAMSVTDVIGEDVDLFSEQYFPIVLIGTSYSADDKWGFEGFLMESLQQDVLNLSDKGLGPFEVMQNYRDGHFKTDKLPEWVIWEIPERYLPIGHDFTKGGT
jgi:alginate O-acetyltransferase complex protein AlgJ